MCSSRKQRYHPGFSPTILGLNNITNDNHSDYGSEAALGQWDFQYTFHEHRATQRSFCFKLVREATLKFSNFHNRSEHGNLRWQLDACNKTSEWNCHAVAVGRLFSHQTSFFLLNSPGECTSLVSSSKEALPNFSSPKSQSIWCWWWTQFSISWDVKGPLTSCTNYVPMQPTGHRSKGKTPNGVHVCEILWAWLNYTRLFTILVPVFTTDLVSLSLAI